MLAVLRHVAPHVSAAPRRPIGSVRHHPGPPVIPRALALAADPAPPPRRAWPRAGGAAAAGRAGRAAAAARRAGLRAGRWPGPGSASLLAPPLGLAAAAAAERARPGGLARRWRRWPRRWRATALLLACSSSAVGGRAPRSAPAAPSTAPPSSRCWPSPRPGWRAALSAALAWSAAARAARAPASRRWRCSPRSAATLLRGLARPGRLRARPPPRRLARPALRRGAAARRPAPALPRRDGGAGGRGGGRRRRPGGAAPAPAGAAAAPALLAGARALAACGGARVALRGRGARRRPGGHRRGAGRPARRAPPARSSSPPRSRPPAAAALARPTASSTPPTWPRRSACAAPPRVTVFVHRSDEEKRRHVGAGGTSFTKPWLARDPPHRRGLAPPGAAPRAGPRAWPRRSGPGRSASRRAPACWSRPGWSRGWRWRWSCRAAAGPSTSGRAALARPRAGCPTWPRPARPGRLLDQPRRPAPTPPPGSLLAFLLERHGGAAVAALYRTGDFEAAFGRPLEAAGGRVAGLPRRRCRGRRAWPRRRGPASPAPALFAVPCAREVAALEARAWAEARPRPGRRGLRRAAPGLGAHRPRRPAQDAPATCWRGAATSTRPRRPTWRRRAPAGDADPALSVALASARADLAWRRDRAGRGRRRLAGGARRRPASARSGGCSRPSWRRWPTRRWPAALRPWLLGQADPATALPGLERLDQPLTAYLAARARLSRGEVAAALPLLRRAEAGPLPELLGREARFLLAEARCLAGATAAGARELAALRRGRPAAPTGLAPRPACGAAPSRRGGARAPPVSGASGTIG